MATTHSPASSTSSPLCADLTCLSLGSGIERAEFFLGPVLSLVNASPVQNIREHLAKRVDTDEFYTMKILTLSSSSGDSHEDRQGKVLLHNEFSLLLLLQDIAGLVHQHGLFREDDKIILVFDCIHPHNYDGEGRYSDLMNLQQYIVKQKKLKEREALRIFLLILTTIEAVHKKNIVHRDLKLGNIVLNTRTQEVTLINFALGKHLVREDDLLTDQRGSLAYVSPDVISGEPYAGKPSDMWSLGVLLYTMLYGQFPFYDSDPQELFRKIKLGKISLPQDGHVSVETNQFIRQLIEPDPSKRLTAGVALETMLSIMSRRAFTLVSEPVQVVPEVSMSQDSSECIVPDQNNQTHSHSQSATAIGAGTVDLTTPRLTLNPFLMPDQQARVWFQGSPGTLATSPVSSPTTQFFFPDVSNHIVLHSNLTSGNPFICSVPTGMSQRSASYSIPHAHSNGMQYGISHSLPVSLTSSQRTAVFSISSSPNSDDQTYQMDTSSHLRPHSNTTSPPSSSSSTLAAIPTHRHSFSEGDHTLASIRPPTVHSNVVHHGRRSLGSMLGTSRQRRSSQHSPSRGSTHSLGIDSPRQRRRSHDPSENHAVVLESLQATAHRVSPNAPTYGVSANGDNRS